MIKKMDSDGLDGSTRDSALNTPTGGATRGLKTSLADRSASGAVIAVPTIWRRRDGSSAGYCSR